MKRLLITILLVALATPSLAGWVPSRRSKEAKKEAAEEAAATEEKKGPFAPFEEVTEDAEELAGFFDAYRKPGHLYLAIEPERLGEEFLMYFHISRGVNQAGLNTGTMLNVFEGQLMTLERRENKIFLMQKPHRFRVSDPDDAAMVDFSPSVVASADIASEREDGALLIDALGWFVSDISGVGVWMKYAVSRTPGQPAGASLDPSRSYLESVKAFPENFNVEATLTFSPSDPVRTRVTSPPDTRYVPITVHATLAKLPEVPMEPRVADDRLGNFMTVHKDYSRGDKTFFTRHVNRWRLERGKKVGDLYLPKEPIIYYIDRNVPTELRPYVKAGIEEWRVAFEEAGFKDAIVADLLPREADAEDIRYPTVRWVATDQPSYLAIGPSTVDPRSGEILDADVLFDAVTVLAVTNTWRQYITPSAAIEMSFNFDTTGIGMGGEHVGFMDMMGLQNGVAHAAMVATGAIAPGSPAPIEFVGEFVKFVTMHEVGHTLGLRHNFRASIDTPMERLHDRMWTAEKGVVSSVMEYPAPNLSLGGANGHYYTPTVGNYDRWVIGYAYTPDEQRAAELARLGAEWDVAYGTDEDAGGPGALDPTVNVWDLGEDPLAWSKDRTRLIRELWPGLAGRVLVDDAPHFDLSISLANLLGGYGAALVPAVKYVGGQYLYRDHVGDPKGRPPFVPVERVKQEEAMKHLVHRAFSEDSFDVPQSVLAKLGANRWSHWGSNNTFGGRIDYPFSEHVLGIQSALLSQLLHPFRFARILDAELKFGADRVLTVPQMMDQLTQSIWSEVWSGGRNVPAMRRNLQRAHIDRMITIVTDPPARTPADARAVARAQLGELKKRIDRAATASVDAYTKAHLNEASERIDRALEAGLLLGG